jgi:Glycine cleavage H-protein
MYRIVFMTAFYSVLTIIAGTLVAALVRSRRALVKNQVDDIRWHSDFHDLPQTDRVCRHVLTGEFRSRECPNAFDCRRCETHARLLAKNPLPAADGEEEIFGMSFPLDRFYHRGHTWARLANDGTVEIGLDDLGRRLLGRPDAIELPVPGADIHVNGECFRIRKRDADVRILAPIDGEVLETGGPGADWYLRVRPASMNFLHLLRQSEVRPWLLRELERLQLALTAEGAAPTLADGGVPVEDIAASYPRANWDAVCGEMFLEP